MNTPAELMTARRKSWYSRCHSLGIDDDNQRLIADNIIPDYYRGKYSADRQVSRKLLFTVNKLWHQADAYLRQLEGGRKHDHKRLDGTKSKRISKPQLDLIRIIGRQLGWDRPDDINPGGADHMEYRLQKYAARICKDNSPNAARLLNTLSSKQASDVIRGLNSMRKRYATQRP